MALPAQVEAAAAAADELLAQMNTPQGEQTEPQPDAVATPDTQEVQPEVRRESVAAPVTADRQQLDQAEQRYRTLQGMMNKEIASLNGQVKTLTQQLESAISRLENQAKAPQAASEYVPETKDVENFGSDLVEMVNRVSSAQMARITQAVDGRLATFGQQIAKLYEQIGGTTQHVAQTAEQMFFDKLEKLVPDWEAINADQRFLAWLAEVDPVYGLPRQAALKRAQETLDAGRAAAVFAAFTGPRQQAPKASHLDKQISPKGAATAAPAPSQKKVVSSAEITKFYDDVRRGAYRGREQLAAQMEIEFNTALAEGRVR